MILGTGLTIGKFDPPHRGHSLLFDVASAHVKKLFVVVYDFSAQSAPAETRIGWLRENFPDLDFRIIVREPRTYEDTDPIEYGAQVRPIVDNAKIDIVFTSESYGEKLAGVFGAQYMSVDRDRVAVPCSSTMIRQDPLNNLQWLSPKVRAHYVKRVAVVGSESTGKTMLCEYLADRFQTNWLGEYGREYAEVKAIRGVPGRWSPDEFVHIAREQQRREDEAARRANRVLICDTDAFSTRVWCERYTGADSVYWPIPPAKTSLYLIPYPDVPFVADEVRDSEHLRFWMFERFVDEFKRHGARFEVLRGDIDERRAQAVAAVEREISQCNSG